MERESLARLLEQDVSVEQIAKRFGRHPSTVAYWMDKHGLVAPNRERYAPKGGIAKERLEDLVDAGMTIAAMARELERSKATVRYWLGKYGLRTRNPCRRRSRPAAREAKRDGRPSIVMLYPTHGEAEFSIEGRGYYRCKQCRVAAVTRRRRRVKAVLVAEAGGHCALCDYDRCAAALAFHHLDPSLKSLHVSANGRGVALETLRAEAAKCMLLCANCHAEVEAGFASVSRASEAVSLPIELGTRRALHLNPG